MSLALLFTAVAQCKKVYDVANNVRKVPEEAYVLWQQLDALQPVVTIATRLNTQESTWSLVNKALEVVYEAVVQCDVLLTRSEPDGRPTESESWEEWWASVPQRTTDRVTRVGLIPKLQQRLHMAVTLLQAALSATLLVQRESHAMTSSSSPQWRWPLSAVARARKILHLFEAGRLEDAGNQYQLGQGVLYASPSNGSKKKAGRTCLGSVAVILRKLPRASDRPTEETREAVPVGYELLFVNAAAIAEAIASQQQSSDAANGVVASSRLVDNANAAVPPKIEGAVMFGSGGSLWKVSCSGRALSSDAPLALGLVESQGDADSTKPAASAYEVREFSSCVVPSQVCYFPSSSETYHHVTLEVAHLLLIFCASLGHLSKSQIDAVLPFVVDEGDSCADSDRSSLEAFLSTYTCP